jgi:tetratricopeptide (TPR) repeat protein
VLKNLARQTPAQVLAGLQAGDVSLDAGDSQEKTESILRCIDYSHSNLSPEAQGLLVCLAPFVGVINAAVLPQYSEFLRAQPALAHLPFDRWQEVLQEAADWGLVSPHELPGYLHLQPTLPYFLRSRLHADEQLRQAVEAGFRQLYEPFAGELFQLLNSKEPQERAVGQVLTGVEYENLRVALDLALEAKASILQPYSALSGYLDHVHDELRGLELGERVLARLGGGEEEELPAQFGFEFAGVFDNIAKRKLRLKRFDEAREIYLKALDVLGKIKDLPSEVRAQAPASIYHQLGAVAAEQRQWSEAESCYKQALQIYIDFNDRYEQAGTYHQLGRVAEEQRQWSEAESYYKEAIQIFIEFNDRHSQAGTYHQLGRVAQEQRQWFEAESYYKQALRIYIEFNDRHSQARAPYQLGVIAQEQRQWFEAESYYKQALQIYIAFNDRHSQALTYHQLGIVAQEQYQWSEAESYYKQALQIKIAFNDRHSQASTYHQLGRVAQKHRQWQQAREYLLEALGIWNQYRDEHHGAIALSSLARLWKASGDPELPNAVAGVFGVSPEEAKELLRKLES